MWANLFQQQSAPPQLFDTNRSLLLSYPTNPQPLTTTQPIFATPNMVTGGGGPVAAAAAGVAGTIALGLATNALYDLGKAGLKEIAGENQTEDVFEYEPAGESIVDYESPIPEVPDPF